ncbi:precorrin-6y C5,15-methyltransferase (decarboxylating) subunit CbiE [Mycolicibacillus parakoreensis]|uniref:Precorrin-6y C5,15-methyltransferase (Decarboxylating) subunit CbiE n=1 Tax=Mycolicibacillus parakoreensis TaxID=1069221 RepID=A0ABY3U4Q8_9MYCO|nr:precorrin-6y C5,15-methyltransferase (decarboxylating) subunit CbiE [Mycolicibacillus parakoreensis]MCV7314009.1 precorrin-6y C5,15-methyltransferase (decarboxylating) subunit CbiE [Mycolicibacillus parakoreensis]ULN54125.1 precorrin-6y C5,15-methyltransferase (decarboxylating) subunit CbiE [Mycolicibacillus parakoreensis]
MSRIVVVGIGADGLAGLGEHARTELATASRIYGSRRQLDLLDGALGGATRHRWPSPLLPALPSLFDGPGDVHVLASGDPLLHGIGTTLIRLFGAERVTVVPHVSAVTLACARMGWAAQQTEVISLVNAEPATALRRGGQAIVLSAGAATPTALAGMLESAGRGDSAFTVLEQLGGPAERRRDSDARRWAREAPADVDDLNVIAVRYRPDERTRFLPDDAFDHDGQITKADIRALTLLALDPRPGQRLWDVGAGAGSIAIEWCRSWGGCTAVAFERDQRRRIRLAGNADALGARVEVRGAAPAALGGAATPDAVFIGGGLTEPGLLSDCLAALPPGGRLIANAVTVESESILARSYSEYGGELRRFHHAQAVPLGSLTTWRAHHPITQWAVTVS